MNENYNTENEVEEPITLLTPKTEEVIEKDGDNEEDISGDMLRLYPYDPATADIDIRDVPHTVFELMRKYDRKQLIIDPEYQRNLVWKPDQMSRFVESVILNFPLPAFYVNEQRDGKYVIVDGLQRTTTLHRFISNQFDLQNLKTLPNFNGQKFKDLPDAIQAKIEDKRLQFYVIRPSVPINVVYELFDRINTGGTPLNRQEVRNCIFMGRSTALLNDLARKPYFKKAIDDGVSATRMKDKEVILRYLAFTIFDYKQDYQGDLSEFLERAMLKINEMQEGEIENLEKGFERVMKLTHSFFGKRNFRYSSFTKNGNVDFRGFINTSVMESVAFFFSGKTDEYLQTHRDQIIRNFDTLLQNPEYNKAARFSTGSKKSVITRFELASAILGNVETENL